MNMNSTRFVKLILASLLSVGAIDCIAQAPNCIGTTDYQAVRNILDKNALPTISVEDVTTCYTFKGEPRVETLNLSSLRIFQITTDLNALTALKTLNLADNLITKIPPGLIPLPELESIDLQKNGLDSLTLEFAYLNGLKVTNINLAGNRVRYIGPLAVKSGIRYNFEGNNICELDKTSTIDIWMIFNSDPNWRSTQLPICPNPRQILQVSSDGVGCIQGEPVFSTSISSAVNSANSGDEVVICDGVYNEELTVTKSLIIRRASAEYADIIVPGKQNGRVQLISSNELLISVQYAWGGFHLRGLDLEMQNSGATGIRLYSGFALLEDVTITGGSTSYNQNISSNQPVGRYGIELRNVEISNQNTGFDIHQVGTFIQNLKSNNVNDVFTNSGAMEDYPLVAKDVSVENAEQGFRNFQGLLERGSFKYVKRVFQEAKNLVMRRIEIEDGSSLGDILRGSNKLNKETHSYMENVSLRNMTNSGGYYTIMPVLYSTIFENLRIDNAAQGMIPFQSADNCIFRNMSLSRLGNYQEVFGRLSNSKIENSSISLLPEMKVSQLVSGLIIKNSIVKGNGAPLFLNCHGINTLENSIIDNANCTNVTPPSLLNKRNVSSVNPLFVNPSSGDLHLQATSPAINTGDPATTLNDFITWSDLDGKLRIWANIVDQGAYEYPRSLIPNQAPICQPFGNLQVAYSPGVSFDVPFSVTDDGYIAPLTYTWAKRGTNGSDFDISSSSSATTNSFRIIPKKPGIFQVQGTATDGEYACSQTAVINFTSDNLAPVCRLSASADVPFLSSPSGTASISATDDGKWNPLVYTWEKAGTNQSDFTISSSSATGLVVKPLKAGSYNVVGTVYDGELSCKISKTFNFCAPSLPSAYLIKPSPSDRCVDGVAGKEDVYLNNPFVMGACAGTPVDASSVAWVVRANGQVQSGMTPINNGFNYQFPQLVVGTKYDISYSAKDQRGNPVSTQTNFTIGKCQEKDQMEMQHWHQLEQKRDLGVLVPAPNDFVQDDYQGNALDQREEIRLTAKFDLNCACTHSGIQYSWEQRMANTAYDGTSRTTTIPQLDDRLTVYGIYYYRVTMKNGAGIVLAVYEFSITFGPSKPIVNWLINGCDNAPKYCTPFWAHYLYSQGKTLNFSQKDQVVPPRGSGILNGKFDDVMFLAAPVEGDFDVTVEALSSSGSSDIGTCGLLLRKSLNASDESYFAGSVGGKNVLLNRPKFYDTYSSSSAAGGNFFRIARVGNILTLEVKSSLVGTGTISTINNVFGAFYLGFANGNSIQQGFQIASATFAESVVRPQEAIKTVFPDGNLIRNSGFENTKRVMVVDAGVTYSDHKEGTATFQAFEGRFYGELTAKPAGKVYSTGKLQIAASLAGTPTALRLTWMYQNTSTTALTPVVVFTNIAGTVLSSSAITTSMLASKSSWTEYSHKISSIPTNAAYVEIQIIPNASAYTSTLRLDNLLVSPMAGSPDIHYPQTSVTIADGLSAPIQTMRIDRSGATPVEIVAASKVDAQGRIEKSYPTFVNSDVSKIGKFKSDYVTLMSSYLSSSESGGNYVWGKPQLDPNWPQYGETEYERGFFGRPIMAYGFSTDKVVKTSFGPESGKIACYPVKGECTSGNCSVSSASSSSSQTGPVCTEYRVMTVQSGAQAKDTYVDGIGSVVKTVTRSLSSSSQQLIENIRVDVFGHAWEVETPGNKIVNSAYDNAGRVIEKSSVDEGTSFSKYDNTGKVRFLRDAEMTAQKVFVASVYDRFGRLRSLYQIRDNATWSKWNDDSRLQDATWPEQFNKAGDAATDRILLKTNYYDEAFAGSPEPQAYLNGRPSAEVSYDPKGSVTRVYSYDQNGKLISSHLKVLSRPWVSMKYTYNNGGMLLQKTIATASTTKTYEYRYDNLNRLLEVVLDGGMLLQYDYWPTDKVRVIKYAGSGGNTLQFHYDIDGRVDRQGHYVSTNGMLAMADTYQEALDFGTDDNILAKKYRVGTTASNAKPWRKFDYQYDAFNRLLNSDFSYASVDWTSVTTSEDLDESLTYGNDGEILTLSRGAGGSTGSYQYKLGTHQLDRVTGLIRTGGMDRSTSGNFIYDASGRLLVDKGTKRVLSYNWLGLPSSVVTCSATPINQNGWQCPTGKIISTFEYVYDGAGNRVAKFTK